MDKKIDKQPKTDTESFKIWQAIRELSIEMFALPNQIVSNYCKPVDVEPSKLYLIANAAALLPALELVLKGKYNVELVDKYIVVSVIDKK